MSDIKVLEIPKWGLSMDEGAVVEWLIAVGDDFTEGQEICEIESSKIVNVLEAPFAGTLRKIIAVTGEFLPVQAPIGIVAPAEVTDAAVEEFTASLGSSAPTQVPVAPAESNDPAAPKQRQTAVSRKKHISSAKAPVAESTVVDIPAALCEGIALATSHATPRAMALAEKLQINLDHVTGTGRRTRISLADIRRAVHEAGGQLPEPPGLQPGTQTVAARTGDDSCVSATPLARRLAAMWGLNLLDCRPSGRHGRVAKVDVEAARLRIQGPTPASQASGSESIPFSETEEIFQETVLSGMRETIATRLQQSKQAAPHYRLTMDCRLDSLLDLRRQINADNPAARVSVNDFLVKAAAMALVRIPDCNIQFNGVSIRRFDHAHVAVAVALDSGLITPIVYSADTKGILEISAEISSLVTRAKANTLKAHDFQGGTFTVSNLGMYGVRQFDAIINPPQAAILAVGAGEQRVGVEAGAPVVTTQVTVTLCSDHRVIDGALGAQLLNSFREIVEKPAMMLT